MGCSFPQPPFERPRQFPPFTFDVSHFGSGRRLVRALGGTFYDFPYPEGVDVLVLVATEQGREKTRALLQSKVEHLSVEQRTKLLAQVRIQIKEVMSINQVSLDCSLFSTLSSRACRSVLISLHSPSSSDRRRRVLRQRFAHFLGIYFYCDRNLFVSQLPSLLRCKLPVRRDFSSSRLRLDRLCLVSPLYFFPPLTIFIAKYQINFFSLSVPNRSHDLSRRIESNVSFSNSLLFPSLSSWKEDA